MSTWPSPGNPVAAEQPLAAEQKVIAAMRMQEQRIHAYTDGCPIGGSAAVIGQWVQGFDNLLWDVLQFVPITQSLKDQGYPAASQYLEAFSKDFAGARERYAQMYQSTVAVQSTWADIWRDANQFTIDTISQVAGYRQAVFDNWVQGWFDVNEQRCFDCHRLIGVPGGGYCLECARRRGLIR